MLPAATDSSSDARLEVLAHVLSASSIALTVDGAKAFVGSPDTGAVFEIDTQTRAIRAVAGFPTQPNPSQESRCAQQGRVPLLTRPSVPPLSPSMVMGIFLLRTRTQAAFSGSMRSPRRSPWLQAA